MRTTKTKDLFVGYLGAEILLVLALGIHYGMKHKPKQTEAPSAITPLDENFENNQSEFIKTYAKGCYKRWKDSMTNSGK
jgi:hypothetical protein